MPDLLSGIPVLVTGAGGFIGSHLVEALVTHGAQVRAYVRYNSRGGQGALRFIPKEIYHQLEVIPGDLRDLNAVREAMRGVQIIYHLGALIAIPYSYLHPAEVVETNIIGTLNVLLSARDLGIERIIHTSTSEVYGTAKYIPISEEHPLQGQSPYSASKIGADKLVESFYNSYDLPVTTLRPFNTYGPRQSARAVIPTIITQALTQEVINLGNLDARRDLTFVQDTVDGFLKLTTATNVEGETFNLGSGMDISIRELANKIVNLIGVQCEIRVDHSRVRPEKSEVLCLLSDNSFARERLAWQPQVDLSTGLSQTIGWIAAHLDHYQASEYQI